MTAFLDTNILIRHLTGKPPEQAARATRFLTEKQRLLLVDVVVAEVMYVLSSVYKATRTEVAKSARSVIGFRNVVVEDPAMLLRAVEVYEKYRLDFADAYLIAQAERSGDAAVVSFDKAIGRVGTVEREEPA